MQMPVDKKNRKGTSPSTQTNNDEVPVNKKIRINPNSRANENVPDDKKRTTTENSQGVGSEITDGEDG